MPKFICILCAATVLLSLFAVAESQDKAPQSPKVQMSVSDRIKDAFTAEEKDIRKLREIVETRISQMCPQSRITLQMDFSDKTVIKTDDIDTILNVRNNPPQTITYISIRTDRFTCQGSMSGPEIQVEMSGRSFDQGLSYSINGSDRDWVYLSQSDISQYMKSMVIDYGLSPRIWGLVLTCSITFLFLTICVFGAYRSTCKDIAKRPNSKPLQFGEYLSTIAWIIFPASFVLGALIAPVAESIGEVLWPSSNFLIGDGIKRYESHSSIIQNAGLLILGSVVIPVLGWIIKKFLPRSPA